MSDLVHARTIGELLAEHAFFSGLDPADAAFLAGCGRNAHFREGQYLLRERDSADQFFVIREGRVALEVFAPGRGPLVIDTLTDGELVGMSWLIPPYRWEFDARAVTPVRAVVLDGRCIREKCEQDPRLGYALMKRLALVVHARLQATRLRLLDLYGGRDGG